MRTLIYALILFSLSAESAPLKLSTSYSTDEEITAIDEANIKTNSSNLNINGINLNEFTSLNFGLSVLKQDLSQRNLINQSGEEVQLSSIDDGIRNQFNLSVDFNLKNHFLTFASSQDLKKTAFARRGYLVQDQISFYNQATQVFIGFDVSEQEFPLSYFIHPKKLSSEARATNVKSQTYSLGVSQIWTERYMSRFSLELKKKDLYRPDQTTIKLNQSYAASERITYKAELGSASDNRNQDLAEDRGYFSTRWLDQEINYEWRLDSFVGLGWSTIQENEVDPRRKTSIELGSDEIGFLISQTLLKSKYSLILGKTQNSEKQEALRMEGVFEWTF